MMVAAYQGFVDVNYQRIHWRQWLQPVFWQQVGQTISGNQPTFLGCENSVIDSQIGNQDSNKIYGDAEKIVVVCQASSCAFKLNPEQNDLASFPTEVQVVLHQSLPAGQTTPDVKILWADLTKRRIVYEVTQLKTVYVISFDLQATEPKLLHDIALEPGLNQVITLLAIKRAADGQDYLAATSQSRKELYLYGLDRKWLKFWRLPSQITFAATQSNDTTSCLTTDTGEVLNFLTHSTLKH